MGRLEDQRREAMAKYYAGFQPATGSISVAVRTANEDIKREAWVKKQIVERARRMETGKIEVED